jgi:hypothetical protein
MVMRITTQWLMTGASIVLFCGFGVAQETARSRTMPLGAIIQAMETAQMGVRPHVSYEVIREYRLAGANDSRSDSVVIAELDFRPPASENYRIQKSSGNSRGQQVVRRVLENEVEAASDSHQKRTAISRDNYDFAYIGQLVLDGQPCYLVRLKPKRQEKDLISGTVWVDTHSFLIRQIDGDLARTPSWWVKKVRVKLTFADLDGTWLESGVEAVADVRVVGSYTLTSHILDYRSAAEVASTRSTRSPDRKP